MHCCSLLLLAIHCILFTCCSLLGSHSVCLALSVYSSLWSMSAAAELNCGISKGINVGCWPKLFPDLSQIWRAFTDARCEQDASWKAFIVCFQIISKQPCRHRGGVAHFKGWQRSLGTWSIQAQSSFSCTQTKTALCLWQTYIHHIIIKPTEHRIDGQTVCVLR